MENSLCNKKVQLVPVIRDSGWLDKGHDGKFLFSGAQQELELKKDEKKGFIDPLEGVTEATKRKIVEAFALDSIKDLSVHKKENNFWLDRQRRVRLDKNGLYWDLSNPVDFVHYRLASTYTENFIAPSWEERNAKLSYKWAFRDEDTVVESTAVSEKEKVTAYTKFGQMQANEHDMFDFLLVYYYTFKDKTMFPHFTWTSDKFITCIGSIIDNNIARFVKIVNDNNYKYRVLIYRALNLQILTIVNKNQYQLKGTDTPIGTIEEAIEYYRDNKNNKEYMTLQAMVDEKARIAKV